MEAAYDQYRTTLYTQLRWPLPTNPHQERAEGRRLTGLGFEVHAASLAAARERAVRLGIAAGRVDDLARDIRAAKGGGYEWVSSGFVFDLTLRKPAAA
jgi:hypothetical protein